MDTASDALVVGLLHTLVAEAERREGYDREVFRHWVDADGGGCDTRQEVLIRDAQSAPQMDPDRRCKVVGGVWVSLYDGRRVEQPSQLDIDHVVPLAEAWESGAWS